MDSVAAGREADDESMVVEVDSTEGADADVTAANETTVSTPVNDPPMRVMHRSICHDYVSLTAIFFYRCRLAVVTPCSAEEHAVC